MLVYPLNEETKKRLGRGEFVISDVREKSTERGDSVTLSFSSKETDERIVLTLNHPFVELAMSGDGTELSEVPPLEGAVLRDMQVYGVVKVYATSSFVASLAVLEIPGGRGKGEEDVQLVLTGRRW